MYLELLFVTQQLHSKPQKFKLYQSLILTETFLGFNCSSTNNLSSTSLYLPHRIYMLLNMFLL